MAETRNDLDQTLDEDLRALGMTSMRRMPPLAMTLRKATAQMSAAPQPGGLVMMFIRTVKSHPRRAIMLSSMAVAAALLLVPVPYQRIIGHDVRLTLSHSSSQLDATQA